MLCTTFGRSLSYCFSTKNSFYTWFVIVALFTKKLFFFFKIFKKFIMYLFIYGCVGLRFCARAFSCCGKWGPLLIAVRGPLIIAASLVAEHRLSNCGSRAQLLRGMWDLPRPGLEPVSPALAGRFSTTAPPGKPKKLFLNSSKLYILYEASPLNGFLISMCNFVSCSIL